MAIRNTLLIAVAVMLLHGAAVAVPAFPGWQKATDYEGNVVTFRLQGDEYFHWIESQSGEVLVWQNEHLYYATLDPSGTRFISSGQAVTAQDDYMQRFANTLTGTSKTATRSDAVALYHKAKTAHDEKIQRYLANNEKAP